MNPHAQSLRHPSRAFTLVEVLVVIVIIIALAAVVFPMARSIRQAAGTAKTVTNLRQIQAANASFASDNNGFFLGMAFHNKGQTCDVVFADGHVASLTRKDVEKEDAKTKRYFLWDAD
jgi:prepilin-type processing-associated H-X9-DG protein